MPAVGVKPDSCVDSTNNMGRNSADSHGRLVVPCGERFSAEGTKQGPMAPNRERLPPTFRVIFMILEGLNRVLESTTG